MRVMAFLHPADHTTMRREQSRALAEHAEVSRRVQSAALDAIERSNCTADFVRQTLETMQRNRDARHGHS